MIFKKSFLFSLVAFTLFSVLLFGFSPVLAADPLAPANGSALKTLTPELSWTIDQGAVKYDIWMLKKSKKMFGLYTFLGRFIREANETTLKIKTGMLEDNSDYLWMVRTVSKASALGSFGKTF
ncbi:MAG TPA: hypothetical protein PKL57_16310, partial [Candidatus Wallbacteria bacterium]|nr:hypothetical protein [Candidatus Wallbacteria bacterium]